MAFTSALVAPRSQAEQDTEVLSTDLATNQLRPAANSTPHLYTICSSRAQTGSGQARLTTWYFVFGGCHLGLQNVKAKSLALMFAKKTFHLPKMNQV